MRSPDYAFSISKNRNFNADGSFDVDQITITAYAESLDEFSTLGMINLESPEQLAGLHRAIGNYLRYTYPHLISDNTQTATEQKGEDQ